MYIKMISWFDSNNVPLYSIPDDLRNELIMVTIRGVTFEDKTKIQSMIDWCEDNVNSYHIVPFLETTKYLTQQQFYFKDRNDALRFKLTWL
jgi:hypothetical protein